MKILEALRRRRSEESGRGIPAGTGAPPEPGQLPIAGYDGLSSENVRARLAALSQVDLGVVESYERDHRNRPAVLDKLRYMRTSEPFPGNDALSLEQITDALADADATTVKAVRDYERKFRHRPDVMNEAARVLPTAALSADADRAREAREARVRAGFASREQTARDLRG
jgi:hypothetical protein